MKSLGGVVFVFVLAMLAVSSTLAEGPAQDSKSVVHPAPASQVITVTVTEVRRTKHNQDKDVLIAQAVGFPNDTCDVITTFDVVKKYEEREVWSNVKQRVEIVVNGTPYPAKFRDLGFYPLGLNLACIDFESPFLRTQLKIPVLPLDRDSSVHSSLSFDEKEIANSDPGTPFLNQQGEISSVLVGADNGQMEFLYADEIRAFLGVAADVAPGPALRRRSFSSI
jgi:hypothetical protein